MSKLYLDTAAEREATEVGKKFMHSSDVVGDMSRAYGTDLSSVRIHADSDSDRRTAQRGVDAFSTGNDVFFARAAFNKNDPASRGLLAHELSHSIQQGVGGEMGGMTHSAPMGAEQGGLIDWFRNLFKKKPKEQNKEDTLDFKLAGESRPEVNGRKMNIKQLNAAANDSSTTPFDSLMANLGRDKNGQYAGGRTDQRRDLGNFIKDRYKGRDEENLLDRPLQNASGTITIAGLNSSRLTQTLKSATGGSMSNEEIGKLYDNLLSGGNAAVYNNLLAEVQKKDATYKRLFGKEKTLTAQDLEYRGKIQEGLSQYSEEGIKERDDKFMAGALQLKGIYLEQLRRIKNKYGTYITQMHPEDFLNKVGMSFYEDFMCMQDVIQMMDYDKTDNKLFDFENNAEDREYKQLALYYFNASNMLNAYANSDMDMESAEFNPTTLEFVENDKVYTPAALASQSQIGGPGFSEKEYGGYLKRMKKRFKKEKKANRLFGRFK